MALPAVSASGPSINVYTSVAKRLAVTNRLNSEIEVAIRPVRTPGKPRGVRADLYCLDDDVDGQGDDELPRPKRQTGNDVTV